MGVEDTTIIVVLAYFLVYLIVYRAYKLGGSVLFTVLGLILVTENDVPFSVGIFLTMIGIFSIYNTIFGTFSPSRHTT